MVTDKKDISGVSNISLDQDSFEGQMPLPVKSSWIALRHGSFQSAFQPDTVPILEPFFSGV
jgi:hypothetical protein